MDLSTAVKERIVQLSKENKTNLHKVCLTSGVPYSTLSSFINGKSKHLTIGTLLHLCEGLNISLADFFTNKVFDDIEDDLDR